MLTVDTAATKLLALELLDSETVLSGDLEITSMTRRNRNLIITSRNAANYIIKQATELVAAQDGTLLTEARLYAYCFRPVRAQQFAEFMPQVVYTDQENNLLIMSLFKGAYPLWRYYRTRTAQHFPVATVRAVGRLLRQFHRLASHEALLNDPELGFLKKEPPFAFNLPEPPVELLSYASPGSYQLLQQVQGAPAFVAALREMKATWQLNSLIHGDIKMDNFLVLDPNTPTAEGSDQVRLIDWEMAQLGDAAWDIAGVFQDFIFWWVISMPQNAPYDTDMVAKASFPVALVQTGAQAFWHSYCQQDPATEALLPKVLNFTTCRLLQTAYELSSRFDYVPRPASILLQIAINLLADRERGTLDLLGLSLPPVEKPLLTEELAV